MRSVRVFIQPRFASDAFDVFFLDGGGPRPLIWRWQEGEWRAEERAEAAELEPSLILTSQALEGLVRAAEGHVHAQDATVTHLADATTTRDRLLSLIEKRGLR